MCPSMSLVYWLAQHAVLWLPAEEVPEWGTVLRFCREGLYVLLLRCVHVFVRVLCARVMVALGVCCLCCASRRPHCVPKEFGSTLFAFVVGAPDLGFYGLAGRYPLPRTCDCKDLPYVLQRRLPLLSTASLQVFTIQVTMQPKLNH